MLKELLAALMFVMFVIYMGVSIWIYRKNQCDGVHLFVLGGAVSVLLAILMLALTVK